MDEKEKNVESLEENKDKVETLDKEKEDGVFEPLEKGTVVFLLSFLGFLILFVLFLPNISDFFTTIFNPEQNFVAEEEEENKDEKKNDLVELEDIDASLLKNEVNGDYICTQTNNTGLFSLDRAYGYVFVGGELITVNEYTRLRYASVDTLDVAKELSAEKQNAYVANNGITGTTTFSENAIIDKYVYDLTTFDYTTEILLNEENVSILTIFTSLDEESVLAASTEDGMTCTEVTTETEEEEPTE